MLPEPSTAVTGRRRPTTSDVTFTRFLHTLSPAVDGHHRPSPVVDGTDGERN
jgi:hypothetical protein